MPITRVKPHKKPTKRPRANKAPSISKLKKKLDQVFSEWNRRRFADSNGMVKSFTGNEIKHWKQLHNGHYITRAILALRWHPDNARPQSPAENIWKHGNPIEFRINLVKEIGEPAVLELESRRKELFKPTRQFYEENIALYTQKLSEVAQGQP